MAESDSPPSPALAEQRFDREALALAEESAGIGVWSIDLATGLVRGTAQFFRILGLPPSDDAVPLERIRALRHPDDRERVVAGFRAAIDSGTDAYEIEYRIIRPDGTVRWIFGRGRVVRDARGAPARYSGVDLDITARKEAEAALAAATEALARMNRELETRVQRRTEELEAEARRRIEAEARLHQAQKMQAVGQLTGGIAHDFNNILQVIVGNLQIATMLLQQGGPVPPSAATREAILESIETAKRASSSAAQLVQRLLAFSRTQTLEPAPLDVNELIGGMGQLIGRTIGETIDLSVALAPGVPRTFADRNQLESAVLNLVVNARDAMPEGGRLVIRTSDLVVGPDGADDIPPGRYVAISVEDTGFGIPREIVDRVFEPFFTTKDTGKGSGLGLSMVYGFVRQSGGHVRIASEVGHGTTVRILLPEAPFATAHAAPRDAPTAEAQPTPARPGETVLVVEDNEEVRRLGVAALRNLGYRVLEAGDGPSALRLLESPAQVDVLFTDVVLPGGMSGRVLADAVHARRPGLPVVFTSGYARLPANGEPLLDSHDVTLQKPYSLQRLASSIREALDARRTTH